MVSITLSYFALIKIASYCVSAEGIGITKLFGQANWMQLKTHELHLQMLINNHLSYLPDFF